MKETEVFKRIKAKYDTPKEMFEALDPPMRFLVVAAARIRATKPQHTCAVIGCSSKFYHTDLILGQMGDRKGEYRFAEVKATYEMMLLDFPNVGQHAWSPLFDLIWEKGEVTTGSYWTRCTKHLAATKDDLKPATISGSELVFGFRKDRDYAAPADPNFKGGCHHSVL